MNVLDAFYQQRNSWKKLCKSTSFILPGVTCKENETSEVVVEGVNKLSVQCAFALTDSTSDILLCKAKMRYRLTFKYSYYTSVFVLIDSFQVDPSSGTQWEHLAD